MKLSQHFTLEEFLISQTASRLGLDNNPTSAALLNLKNTANGMEEVRLLLNSRPIIISSGYRAPKVNKAVGSSSKSQHVTGEAVDFSCPQFGNPRQIVFAIVASNIKYDQVILEFNSWVHISFSPRNRKQSLIIDNKGARLWA